MCNVGSHYVLAAAGTNEKTNEVDMMCEVDMVDEVDSSASLTPPLKKTIMKRQMNEEHQLKR